MGICPICHHQYPTYEIINHHINTNHSEEIEDEYDIKTFGGNSQKSSAIYQAKYRERQKALYGDDFKKKQALRQQKIGRDRGRKMRTNLKRSRLRDKLLIGKE